MERGRKRRDLLSVLAAALVIIITGSVAAIPRMKTRRRDNDNTLILLQVSPSLLHVF